MYQIEVLRSTLPLIQLRKDVSSKHAILLYWIFYLLAVNRLDRSRITNTIMQDAPTFQNKLPRWAEIEGVDFGCVSLKNEIRRFHEILTRSQLIDVKYAVKVYLKNITRLLKSRCLVKCLF